MAYTLETRINRQTHDFTPSPIEIYYEQFGRSHRFVYHAGITDRYADVAGDDYNEGDDDDMPNMGLTILNHEIQQFTKAVGENPYFKDCKTEIYHYNNHEANVFIATIVFIGTNTLVHIRISPQRSRTLTAFSIFTDNQDREGVNLFIAYAQRFIKAPPPKKDRIHIITQSGGDFYLKSIPLKNRHSTDFSYDNYNEEFEEISNRLISALTVDSSCGIVLFHGDPGTGKTSYLKHLIHTISNKKLIYMPPDLTEHLSSPGFVTFLMGEAENSILLIEDAENVLRAREAGGSQAVSNILNISDGILGDVLKLQIVCTFNSKLEEIDSALRRPGRCIAEYRFEPLEPHRAAALMRKVHGDEVEFDDTKPMTLADVYNFNKPRDVTKTKRRTAGFIPLD